MKKLLARPSRRTLVIIALLFLLACLIRVPASLITLALPQDLQLRNVEGTFWNGSASALGVGGMLVQEHVEWHFQPASLLGAKFEWAVRGRLADKASRLNLSLRPGRAEIHDLSVFLPLEPFAALHPRLKAAQLGAELHATATQLAPDQRASIQFAIARLFSPLVPQDELGSYTLEIDVEPGGRGSWRIVPVAGKLQIAGSGDFDAARNSARGQVTLTPQAPMPGLTPLLSTLPKAGEGFQLVF